MTDSNLDVIDGTLRFTSSVGGQISSQGKPIEVSVLRATLTPDRQSAVVLLDWSEMQDNRAHNLIRVDCKGAVLWTAPLPHSSTTDCYTDFDLDSAGLAASTWQGYRVPVALDDGKIQELKFTK
ncbi:hypothetical protein B7R22_17825 [Subtercola boreus]|uniref:Uncharacterized protein n=1 Tax=Subtercola boreus TaxID=120213 RepID=A0A3E0VQH9_9MICO|nr:hypothetical protein B7R22_17825 [Subtercola boreus]